MENSVQTPENKPMPTDPKPNDDVQLHIETVIPEAENEAISTNHKAPTAKEEIESPKA